MVRQIMPESVGGGPEIPKTVSLSSKTWACNKAILVNMSSGPKEYIKLFA